MFSVSLKLTSHFCYLQTIIHTREMFQLLLDKLRPLDYEQYFASYIYKDTSIRYCSLSNDMECFQKNYTISNMCAHMQDSSNAFKFD